MFGYSFKSLLTNSIKSSLQVNSFTAGKFISITQIKKYTFFKNALRSPIILSSKCNKHLYSAAVESDNFKDVFLNYFQVTPRMYTDIICSNNALENLTGCHLQNMIKICEKCNIDKEIILQNLFVLQIEPDAFKSKLKIIQNMHFKNINHGVPFSILSETRLVKLLSDIWNESTTYKGNKLYYLSDTMKVDPQILATCTSKRLFVYTMPFDHLQNTLDVLLSMHVSPKNIIKDLWVLKYNPKTCKDRLQNMKNIGKKQMMPWMVRCTESVYKRCIDLTISNSEVLGNNTNLFNYLSSKLSCSTESILEMATKIPAINRMHVTKARDIIDYLQSEGFEMEDIINTPRVLAHSLVTLQTRLKELRSIGHNPKNLNILCRSKREFKKCVSKQIKASPQTKFK